MTEYVFSTIDFKKFVAHEVFAYMQHLGFGTAWNNHFPEQITEAVALDCNRDPRL
jgi:hypothetical protein